MSGEQLLTAAETAKHLEISLEELAQWIADGVEGLDAKLDVRSHAFSSSEIGVLEEREVRLMCGRFGDWTEVFKGYSPSEREAMWLEEISSPADIPSSTSIVGSN
jgi:hypothetical protein